MHEDVGTPRNDHGDMTSPAQPAGDPPTLFVVATLPPENVVTGSAVLAAHADVVDEITPCVHRIGRRGGIAGVFAAHDAHAVAESMAVLRAGGRPLLPGISDEDGASASDVREMLRDPAVSSRHVWALADLVRRRDHAGLEVRYAALAERDEEAVSFTRRLAEALHADDRRLAIAIEPDDTGAPAIAAEVAAAVDEVRIATYDFHWASSQPGPLAPLDWLRQQIARAARTVAAEKLVAGVPAAGYHWAGSEGTAIDHDEAVALAEQVVDGRVGRDPASGSRWFAWTDALDTRHEVWFEDASTLAVKCATAAEAGVRAVSLWLAANPDPALWDDLGRRDRHAAPAR